MELITIICVLYNVVDKTGGLIDYFDISAAVLAFAYIADPNKVRGAASRTFYDSLPR